MTKDDVEARFQRKLLAYHIRNALDGGRIFAVVTLILAAAEGTLAAPFNRDLAVATRLATALYCVVICWMAKRQKGQWHFGGWTELVVGVFNMPYAWMAVNYAAAGQPDGAVAPLTIYFVQGCLGIFFLPGRLRYLLAYCAMQEAVFCFATRHDPETFGVVAAFGAFYLAISAILFHGVYKLLERTLRTEARSELELLPHGLVLDDADRARGERQLKRCVVLASDWRGYQAMTKGAQCADIALTLARYYDLVQSLLVRHGAGIECMSDWIADELLVHAWVSTEDEERRAVAALLAFARDLIAAKATVHLPGRPIAIDVGIAAVDDVVGLFGPAGRQKLMVGGRALVAARRLQTEGKELRRVQGEADRIIYDARVVELGRGAAVGYEAPRAA